MGFDAHLTLLYLGKTSPEQETKVLRVLSQIGPQEFLVGRNCIDLFGANRDIPVLKVNDITDNLKKLLKRLGAAGLRSRSEYPFNPHISLKLNSCYGTLHLPMTIKLNQLGLY